MLQGLTQSQRPVGYVVPDPIHQPLYVITTVYNPLRWKSRWKHYERFARQVIQAGAKLYTVEVSFGEREPAVGYAALEGSQWMTLRTSNELWMKEPAINAGVRHLP